MLDLMRKHAGSWMIKVILGVIVIVFVFWGVGSFRDQQATVVASVNGEPIAYNEYLRAYNNLLENLRRQFGDNLTDETIEMLQIKQQAMDQIIDRRLLLIEADRMDIQVSDETLAESLQSVPAFQRNGVFDGEQYRRVLAQIRTTPEEFEEDQRQALRIDALQSYVAGSALVSEAELKQWYQWEEAQVRIDYVHFDPNKYDQIELTDEQVAAYFEQNGERYTTNPRVKVQYIAFAADDYTDQVTIADERIADYYNNNAAQFEQPKTVKARHILIKVDAEADEAAVAEAKGRLLPVLEMARKGEDFGELAKMYSEGPTRERGGDLGEFQKEQMVAPFAEAAFAMQAGEISEPVRTPFGWHLIKVEKVNEASKKPLEAVADEIRDQLRQAQAKELALEAAETLYESVFQGDDLAEVATEQKLTLMSSDFFDQAGPEQLGASGAAFATAALALEPEEISDVVAIEDTYYLIQALEKEAPKVPELAEVRERVEADLLAQKQDEKAKSEAEAFRAQLNEPETDLPKAAQAAGHELKTSSFFKRFEAIPEIGNERAIAEAAFDLTQEDPLAETALKGAQGYYVIGLNERKAPDMEGWQERRDDIEQRVLRQKSTALLNSLIEQLRGQSKIEINEELFKQG